MRVTKSMIFNRGAERKEIMVVGFLLFFDMLLSRARTAVSLTILLLLSLRSYRPYYFMNPVREPAVLF